MVSPQAPAFASVRLHRRSSLAWAVIRRETGAIVVDDQNRLMMRLFERDAARAATELSERHGDALRDGK